ncbi:MAG: DUF3822 family protein [Flavipsychrobacter sp.]|nr:DUF3822 family protein [Flavipsychrobacter sp.]
MSEVINNNLNQQVYSIHNSDQLLNQVERVICVLLPRGLLIAGFSDNGGLLLVRHSDYKSDLPVWILDFYEHQFLNEPILADTNKVTSVFIASDKSYIVPDVLYNEETASEWMKKIHFIEINESITAYPLRDDKAVLLYAWPSAIESLVNRYFGKAKFLPLAAYQLQKPKVNNATVTCCITADAVFATLYDNKTLYWHQYFHYKTAEDIAYQIKLLCTQNEIDADTLQLNCTVTSRSLGRIVSDLTQYFPELKSGIESIHGGENEQNWGGTLYLLQQLYACA